MSDFSNGLTSKGVSDDFYRQVGGKIRQYRVGMEMKQETLAGAVGLTRTSLTNIEKGRQRLMLHTFVALASQLEVQVQALLPTGTAVLEILKDRMPANTTPEVRAWVARTVTPDLIHDKQSQKIDPRRGGKTAAQPRRNRSAG